MPTMARIWRVPMRNIELEPGALGMRFKAEPRGLQRHFVAKDSPADGTAIGDLDLGEDAWVSMVSRHGQLVEFHGGTALEAGDEVLMIGKGTDQLRDLFAHTPRGRKVPCGQPTDRGTREVVHLGEVSRATVTAHELSDLPAFAQVLRSAKRG